MGDYINIKDICTTWASSTKPRVPARQDLLGEVRKRIADAMTKYAVDGTVLLGFKTLDYPSYAPDISFPAEDLRDVLLVIKQDLIAAGYACSFDGELPTPKIRISWISAAVRTLVTRLVEHYPINSSVLKIDADVLGTLTIEEWDQLACRLEKYHRQVRSQSLNPAVTARYKISTI